MTPTGFVALLGAVLTLGVACGVDGRTQLQEGALASAVTRGADSPSAALESDEPATIDSFGFWSLTKLGSGPIEFEDVQGTAKASVPYILEPVNARQGSGNWYQVGLHAKVVFGPGTGRAYLFASHNGYASALIEYEASALGDRRRIVRKATSLIDGSSKETLRSDDDELRYRNYLQYKAVQPGLNHVTFSVEVHGSLQVKRVNILPDSGIDYTRQGPARLTLAVRLPREPLRKGRRAILSVDVRNLGGREVSEAWVSLEYAREDLRNTGSATKRFAILVPNGRRRATFRVIPLHRGTILIGVQAGAHGGNSAGVSKTLNVH